VTDGDDATTAAADSTRFAAFNRLLSSFSYAPTLLNVCFSFLNKRRREEEEEFQEERKKETAES